MRWNQSGGRNMFEAITGFFGAIAAAAFALWTIGFFVFWGVFILLSLVFGLGERYFAVGSLWIFTLIFIVLASEVSIFGFVAANPWTSLFCVLGYLVCGAVWVTFKWIRFVEEMSRNREVAIRHFLKEKFEGAQRAYVANEFATGAHRGEEGKGYIHPSNQTEDWRDFLINNGYAQESPAILTNSLNDFFTEVRRLKAGRFAIGSATEAIHFSDHKSEYKVYFFYWPVDLVIYGIGDILVDIWNGFVRAIQGTYDAWAKKRMFKGIKDLK